MCGGSEAYDFAATSAAVRSGDRKVYHLVDWNPRNFDFHTTLPRDARTSCRRMVRRRAS